LLASSFMPLLWHVLALFCSISLVAYHWWHLIACSDSCCHFEHIMKYALFDWLPFAAYLWQWSWFR
jgi:hypothetical protein